MPAHVTVTRHGDRTLVVCEDCHLQEPHTRWKPAVTAAHAHNDTVHAFPPELDLTDDPTLDLDTDQETA